MDSELLCDSRKSVMVADVFAARDFTRTDAACLRGKPMPGEADVTRAEYASGPWLGARRKPQSFGFRVSPDHAGLGSVLLLHDFASLATFA
jgi:hypothetical protein